MISERELDLNGWERVERRYRMRVPSCIRRWPVLPSSPAQYMDVRLERSSVEQRLNRGWWDVHADVVAEETGSVVDHVHATFRTARGAMAWLQGEPWRRG